MTGWRPFRIPSRDAVMANRMLRPFRRHLTSPLIWRFNRRGVARGVSLGLAAAFIIPIGQTPVAALLALPLRANLPVAALSTMVTNPFTFPFVYLMAYRTGTGVLRLRTGGRAALESAGGSAIDGGSWGASLIGALGPTALGLLIFAIAAALLGYLTTHFVWRWKVSARWARRCRRRGAARWREASG